MQNKLINLKGVNILAKGCQGIEEFKEILPATLKNGVTSVEVKQFFIILWHREVVNCS